jgi:hypothetical protein
VDYGHAINYWRKALQGHGGNTDLLDQLAAEIGGATSDAMVLSFVAMLEACERGEFDHA